MNYTKEHETWYKAFISLLKYMKNRGIDLTDIAATFDDLTLAQKKGLSLPNLKRYKRDITDTRLDGLVKFVKQFEGSYGLQIAYKNGVPQLDHNDEIIMKESKIEAISSKQSRFQRFRCYYLRTDGAVETATLILDLNTGTAHFLVEYQRQHGKGAGKIELAGKFTLDGPQIDGNPEVFLSIFISGTDGKRSISLSSNALFFLRNRSIEDTSLISGTYTTYSRTFGNSAAGVILAERIDPSKPESNVSDDISKRTDEAGNVPGWIGNYLHGKRMIADDIYDLQLREYLMSNSFVRNYSSFVGHYVGYYIRSTGVVPTLEKFLIKIEADGSAIMKSADAPDYSLHFQRVDTRLLVGHLEREISGRQGAYEADKERFGRWGNKTRVMFSLHQIEEFAASEPVLLYGVYAGIEHSSRSPISGRIVLRKLSNHEQHSFKPVSVALDDDFAPEKDAIFIEDKVALRKHIQSYLNGRLLPHHTDHIGAARLIANLPTYIIGDYLCFSIFTEEESDRFKVGKYPLIIRYPNRVSLIGRSNEFSGTATYQDDLLVLDLTSEKQDTEIRMSFRVSGGDWDHAYGVSLGRRGINPESRAEVLLRLNQDYLTTGYSVENVNTYTESYLAEDESRAPVRTDNATKLIKLSELVGQDSRFGNVISFLRGDYNRYICLPHAVSHYAFDYEIRPASERRAPFYAAFHLLTVMTTDSRSDTDELSLDCMKYIQKAHLHGFAKTQNFGDKSVFGEKKIRLIWQFEKEIQQEKSDILKFAGIARRNQAHQLVNIINNLWPEIDNINESAG